MLIKGCSAFALIGAIAANCDSIRHLLVRGVAASDGVSFGLLADCSSSGPTALDSAPRTAASKGLLGSRQCELVRLDAAAVRALASLLCLVLLLHECDVRAVAVSSRGCAGGTDRWR